MARYSFGKSPVLLILFSHNSFRCLFFVGKYFLNKSGRYFSRSIQPTAAQFGILTSQQSKHQPHLSKYITSRTHYEILLFSRLQNFIYAIKIIARNIQNELRHITIYFGQFCKYHFYDLKVTFW